MLHVQSMYPVCIRVSRFSHPNYAILRIPIYKRTGTHGVQTSCSQQTASYNRVHCVTLLLLQVPSFFPDPDSGHGSLRWEIASDATSDGAASPSVSSRGHVSPPLVHYVKHASSTDGRKRHLLGVPTDVRYRVPSDASGYSAYSYEGEYYTDKDDVTDANNIATAGADAVVFTPISAEVSLVSNGKQGNKCDWAQIKDNNDAFATTDVSYDDDNDVKEINQGQNRHDGLSTELENTCAATENAAERITSATSHEAVV